MMQKELRKIYLNAAQKFVRKKSKNLKFYCVLISGSFYTKKLKKNSDLDVYLITNKGFFEKGVKIVDGIKVAYFMNPYKKIIKFLNEERHKLKRPTAELIYFSDCLVNPKKAHKLKILAAKTIESKLPKLTRKEKVYLGWKLYDKSFAIKRKNYDPATKEYLKHDLFEFLLDTFLKTRRTHKPHAKYVLQKLQTVDQKFYLLTKNYLKRRNDKSLKDIVEHVARALEFKQEEYFKRTKAERININNK